MAGWNSLVQSNSGTGIGVASLTVTYPSNVTQGNLLIAHACISGSLPTSMTISDGVNTWNPAVTSAKNNNFIALWYAIVNASAGGTKPSVKVQPNAGTPNIALLIEEFNPGAGPTSFTISLDGTNTAISTTATINPSCGTIPVNGADELVVASTNTAANSTAGTGFTLDPNSVNVVVILAAEYNLDASSPIAGAFVNTTASKWEAVGASFSAVASGGTTWTVTTSDNLAVTDAASRLVNAFRLASDNLGLSDSAIATVATALILLQIIYITGSTNEPIDLTGSV